VSFLKWLCRVCGETFDYETQAAEHVKETGHSEISLRRTSR